MQTGQRIRHCELQNIHCRPFPAGISGRSRIQRYRALVLLCAGLFLPCTELWTELRLPLGSDVTCHADEVRQQENNADSKSELTRLGDDSQQLPTDRRVLLQSRRLEELIRAARYSEALDQLRLLSQSNPSLMVPRNTELWEPVYRLLFRSVFQLPANLQNQLRQESAPLAEAALQQALNQGTTESLLLLIQRFPGSEASCRAHMVLAHRNLNRGRTLAAMLWLQPLTNSGVPDHWKIRSAAILKRLTDQLQKQQTSIPAVAAASEPAAESTSAEVEKVIPQHLHWRQSSTMPPVAKEAIDRLISSAHQLAIIPWTNWRPAVDKEHVYIRTLRGVTAIHRPEGQTAWIWAAGRSLDSQLIVPGRNYEDAPAPPGAAADNTFSTLDRSAIANLLNRNGVIGRLTSDDERLFVIQDDWQSLSTTTPAPFFLRSQARPPEVPPSQLIALDKKTGRRLWTAGGELVEDRYGNELTQAWIAGPPTIHGRLLYCVLEQRDAIYLACLAAETGKLNWKVLLTYPGIGIVRDSVRRMQAAIPTVREGLIWSTTTSGWMIAVDSLTRTPVWAYRTGKSDSAEETRAARGRMFAITPQASLRSGWPDHGPSLSGTQLTVFPGDTPELLILNSLTGELQKRIAVPDRVLVLHADAGRIVVAGPRAISAFNPDDGSRIWESSLIPGRGLSPGPDLPPAVRPEQAMHPAPERRQPTGPGVVRGQNLLVSMSDGSICAFDLADGRLIESRADLTVAPFWGGLFSAGDEVLAYSPSQAALLSSTLPVIENASPLDQAELLAGTGAVDAALKLLESAPTTGPDADQIRQRKFQYLLRLVNQNDAHSATALEQMQQLADSTSEKAEVIRLKVNSQVGAGAISEAIRQIFEALEQEPGILMQQVTQSLNSADERTEPIHQGFNSPQSETFGTLQQPLKNWLLNTLDSLLEQAEPQLRQDTLARLSSAPDSVLLNTPSVELRLPLLHRAELRIRDGDLSEQTLHLLLQSLALAEVALSGPEEEFAPESMADFDSILQQLQGFRDQLSDERTADTPWKAIRLRLLETLLEDFAVRRPRTSPQPDASSSQKLLPAFRDHLRHSWETWPGDSYTAVPVTQSTAWRQLEQPLAPRNQQDAFLCGYEWQLLRTSPFLKARSLTDEQNGVWSVSGNFPNSAAAVQVTDSITRCGSIVAVQSGQTISAFSILDQRMVWSRQLPGPTIPDFLSTRSSEWLFKDYSVQNRAKLGAMFASSLRICGSADRWTCLKSPTRLEIIDNLTGQTRWSLTGSLSRVHAFATNHQVLLVNSETRTQIMLRMVDAAVTESRISFDQSDRTLAATGTELVLFRPSHPDDPFPAVDWVDPVSAEVKRSVSLEGAHLFQLLDTTTLGAMADDSFRVMDLITGEIQHCELPATDSFWSDSGTDADVRSGSRRQSRTICADPINYYLFVRPQLNSPLLTRFVGRNLTAVEGTLHAFDRHTGKLRWTLDTGSSQAATFDQPMAPVLLLIDSQMALNAGPGAPAQGPPGTSGVFFRGILKSTGQQLFEHRLSSRFPIPFVRLMTNSSHQVDVEAYGTRIRFLPPITSARTDEVVR